MKKVMSRLLFCACILMVMIGYAVPVTISTPQNTAATPAASSSSMQMIKHSANITHPTTTITQPAASISDRPTTSSTEQAVSVREGQSYSILDLLQMGYTVEARKFMIGEKQTNNAIGKAAVWRDSANGTKSIWEGVVLQSGKIVIKQSLAAPKHPKVLSKNWTGGSQ